LLEPFDIGLEAARRRHQRGGGNIHPLGAFLNDGGEEGAVLDIERGHFRVIGELHAKVLGGGIERIQHGAAAAEKERIGAAKAERAAERGLKADAMARHPVKDFLRLGNHETRQRLVGLTFGNEKKIVPEFLFRVGPAQGFGRRVVRATHVARVAGIAAAIEFRRGLQYQDRGAGAARLDRGAKRGIAAADDQHVPFARQVGHTIPRVR
jgi:hypothetical protein